MLNPLQNGISVQIIDFLSGKFTIPDKSKEKSSKSLTPITVAILDMLIHVVCNRSRLDLLLVSQKLQISINQKIISSGLAHKVRDRLMSLQSAGACVSCLQ